MVNPLDYYHCLSNYKRMSCSIQEFDIVQFEKAFLEKSLNNTCSFEKATAGKYYYQIGGGSKYNKEILSLCGDYIFLVRVLDNVIDGHINGLRLEEDEAEGLLESFAGYINDDTGKESVEREFSYLSGVSGAIEIAQIFNTSLQKSPHFSA